jgi:hypothetical protein
MQRLGLNPWNVTVGSVLGFVLFLAGAQLNAWLPRERPYERGELTYWRDGTVQFFRLDTLTVNQYCGHVTFDRVFVDGSTNATFRVKALTAPFDPEPIVPVNLKPGRYDNLVWAYEVQKGRHGTFRLWVSPNECQDGFSETYSLFNAPFDWRDAP